MSDQFSSMARPAALCAAVESLDSDILSLNAATLSNVQATTVDSEWVIFSPPEHHAEPEDTDEERLSAFSQLGEDIFSLPAHNGLGSFHAGHARRDLFERINAWRIEQSQYFFGDGELPFHKLDSSEDVQSAWQRLRQQALRGIHHCVGWDSNTIDALFSSEFAAAAPSPPDPATARAAAATQSAFAASARVHLDRARRHGPSGWERKMLGEHAGEPSMLVSVLAKVLLRLQSSKSSGGGIGGIGGSGGSGSGFAQWGFSAQTASSRSISSTLSEYTGLL